MIGALKLVGFVLVLLAISNLSLAQQGRDEAAQLEELRDQANAKQQALEQQAAKTYAQILELQTKLVDVAARTRAQNRLSVTTEEHIVVLQANETAHMASLLADKAALQDVLAALQRSQMSPPPPLAVTPDDTLAAARATLLLGATAPQLQSRANALRISLDELAKLRNQIETQRLQLQQQMQVLAHEQAELEGLLRQRQQLEHQLRGDAKTASSQAVSLAKRAANMRELIRQLEAEARKTIPRIKPTRPSANIVLAPSLKPVLADPGIPLPVWVPPTGRFADSRGQLEMPVDGSIINRFGQAAHSDKVSGMVFETSRRAQIIAPFDARIAFVGEFRNYGQLLILDVGDGYHMILSGLALSYVVKEQSVLAGEPLGKMADRRKPKPVFYLEFRKEGRPFNPEPWLKTAINAG